MPQLRVAAGASILAFVVVIAIGIAAMGVLAVASQNGAPRTSPSSSNAGQPTGAVYYVTFQQIGACTPTFWGIPWSVTIGSTTKVQPPSTKLPISNLTLYSTTNRTLTQIVFALADGTYHYRVSPSAEFFTPSSGTVTVSGSNVTVRIAYTGTSCMTTSEQGASSRNATLLAECAGASNPSAGSGELVSGRRSPAIICIQLYYYDSTAPKVLSLTNALSIQALQYIWNGSVGHPRPFDGASNFTVTASQGQLQIGGPADENEGQAVAFAVTARPGASGTYQLAFLPSGSLTTWMLGAQEPDQCGYYWQLQAGNGQPNYAQITHCMTYTVTSLSTSTTGASGSGFHTLRGVSYPLINGDLYFRVIGVTNSTG